MRRLLSVLPRTKSLETASKIEKDKGKMTGSKNEGELIELARAGDKQAENELFTRYMGLVRSVARQQLYRNDLNLEVEDLMQEGMLAFFNAINTYKIGDGNMSFKNYFSLCVKNRVIDVIRVAKRRKLIKKQEDFELEEELRTPDDPGNMLIFDEDEREFYKKISKILSDLEFRIVVMYLEGMTYAEICESTGRNKKSVDNTLQRSKNKLKKQLFEMGK
jgi:RNA polymerase sporulation-specific sigma factor